MMLQVILDPVTYVRLAQLDRAFGYGPKGRGFESSNARAKYVYARNCKNKELEKSVPYFCATGRMWKSHTFGSVRAILWKRYLYLFKTGNLQGLFSR